VETNVPRPPDPLDAVRCVACGVSYVPAPRAEAACPSCGCQIWISARLANDFSTRREPRRV
jgi:predicted RNA-binding Zn-ribbon protein involved in translation (DUF1610 family)